MNAVGGAWQAFLRKSKVAELDESSPAAEQPPGANFPLKPHQLTLLQRCIDIENGDISAAWNPDLSLLERYGRPGGRVTMRSRLGIIGDCPGSGKSFVIMSLVLAQRCSARASDPRVTSFGNNRLVISSHEPEPVNCSLLVVPQILCSQWVAYMHAFSSSLRCFKVSCNKSVDALSFLNLDAYDVVLVTNTHYNRAVEVLRLREARFRRAVFDDVDGMHLPQCAEVDADMLWFATASFRNLLHPSGYQYMDTRSREVVSFAAGLQNAGFVRNLFNDLYYRQQQDVLRLVVAKNRDAYVLASMDIRAPITHCVRCWCPHISILLGIVDHNVIERLNANDVENALLYVNSANKTSEQSIVNALLARLTRDRTTIASQIFLLERERDSSPDQGEALRSLRDRLAETCSRMQDITNRIVQTDECAICYEEVHAKYKTVTKCCSNVFCFHCINIALMNNGTCPTCRSAICAADLLTVVPEGHGSRSRPVEPLDIVSDNKIKIQNLEAILRQRLLARSDPGEPPARFLIFSSFDKSFVKVDSLLARLRIKYEYLRGHDTAVCNILERYRSGSTAVLLVNSKHFGSGLNLQNTTDIVMFHKHNSEIEQQVVGRAQRMGRTSTLHVWYMLHENEMGA
jgi:hypothetical protein